MEDHKKPALKHCSDRLHKGYLFLSSVSLMLAIALFVRMEAINRKAEITDQMLKKRIQKIEMKLGVSTRRPPEYRRKMDMFSDAKKNTEKRARRSLVSNSTSYVTIQDVRHEITRQVTSLINPAVFCQPSEKLCVPGPPGKKGNRGSRGKRGTRGSKGNKGVQGIVGLPGRHGKQGPTGNPGAEGQKGVKGDIGPRGMPGLKGDPGEAISAPEVIVSPESQTVTENQTAIFYCSASGTPSPRMTWEKVNGSFSERHVFSETNGGKIEIRSPGYNDSGYYACAASNILGRDQKIVHLVVEGPPILIKTPTHFVAINERTTAKLTCEASGYPPPVTQWTRAFSSLPVGRSSDINGTLSIAEFRSEDTGTYVCTATNRLGSARAITVLGIQLIPQRVSCDDILESNSKIGNGIQDISAGLLKLKVYCDITTDRRGWTLIARFSNSDGKSWMNDTGYWWYDQRVAMGTPTNPSLNADMVSPAFWLVSGRELKITRSDDSSHTPLLQTTGNCLGGQTFRSKVTGYGDFRNGKVWSSDKCLGSCTVQYGGQYKSTDGFQQAECSSDIQSADKIGFWCDWSGGDGSVMMIGGGGSSCSRADHGIGITEAGQASFVEVGSGETEYDFGYDASTNKAPSTSYSLNLWIR